jgi:sulfate adenylyltransferase
MSRKSPPEGGRADRSRSVRDTLRLAKINGQRQGTLFPVPITLDVSSEDIQALNISPGARLALRDPRDEAALAILTGEFSIPYLTTSC